MHNLFEQFNELQTENSNKSVNNFAIELNEFQMGCVHFTGLANPQACEIKVLLLLLSSDKTAYIGFIPNDQAGFVDRIRQVIHSTIQQQKSKQGQVFH